MDTFPPFVYLDKSTIPCAGKGVFAAVPLPAGIVFGPYSVSRTSFLALEEFDFSPLPI